MEPAEAERTAAGRMSLMVVVVVVYRRSEGKSPYYKVLNWRNKDRLARLGTM